MKIVIASDSFKESLTAQQACEAMARGARRALPDVALDIIPMADGGEGTADALIAATHGQWRESAVTGPRNEPINARWGILGTDNEAVIEMAAASGLALVLTPQRDPTQTTTFGTGQLIRAALDAGVARMLVAIGGSATNDGGAGAAQAIGYTFYDQDGKKISEPLTGGTLRRIARIDPTTADPHLQPVTIRVACDVDNPLCGPRGAAATYGPQKGASPEQVALLDSALEHLASIIQRDLGKDVANFPGAGAAGGMGAGMVAFFDADIQRGVHLVMSAVRFRERIADADLILTGEGRIDEQSMMGKVLAGVGEAGRRAKVPVIALAGAIGKGAERTLDVLDSFHCIHDDEISQDAAFARAADALETKAAEVLMAFAQRE